MSWIKLDDDTFAEELENPNSIVNLSEEIIKRDALIVQVNSLSAILVPPTSDVDTIKAYELLNIDRQKTVKIIQQRLDDSINLISKLEALNG